MKPAGKRPKIVYACIPRVICAHPRAHDFSPFEIAILGTLISLAWLERGQAIHELAFNGQGAEGIASELLYAEIHKQDWRETNVLRRAGTPKSQARAPKRIHVAPTINMRTGEWQHERYKPIRMRKALKQAGSHSYRQHKKHLRKTFHPKQLVIDIARTALLASAGFSRSAHNLDQLADALRTLSKPIVINDETISSLIVETNGGRLLITISSAWLRTQFLRVPLPLPTKSPHATRLLLWLIHVNPKDDGRDIDFAKLAEMFGFKDWRRQQTFNRAIQILNDSYLPQFDVGALQRDHKIHMPGFIDVKTYRNRVRFVGHAEMPRHLQIRRKYKQPLRRERLDNCNVDPGRVNAKSNRRASDERAFLSLMQSDDYFGGDA